MNLFDCIQDRTIEFNFIRFLTQLILFKNDENVEKYSMFYYMMNQDVYLLETKHGK